MVGWVGLSTTARVIQVVWLIYSGYLADGIFEASALFSGFVGDTCHVTRVAGEPFTVISIFYLGCSP